MSVEIIEQMIGEEFDTVIVDDDRTKMTFTQFTSGSIYKFLHNQDCCESVYIADIDGDLTDLEDAPITMAEVVSECGDDGEGGTFTWTFFKFVTSKGSVTVRWNGESNGYYSERVSLHIQHEVTF